MGAHLVELSGELAAAVESAAPSVVRVEGRRRAGSSGVAWSADGVIVASHHAVDAEEGVPVGLHDGRTVPSRVVGRDPGSDLALLRAEATGLAVPRWDEGPAPKVGQLVLGLSRPGRSARGETRTWSQYWYPIREIGAAQQANLDAALSLRLVRQKARLSLRVGLASTRVHDRVEVVIRARGKVIGSRTTAVSPRKPFVGETTVPSRCAEADLNVTVLLRTERN